MRYVVAILSDNEPQGYVSKDISLTKFLTEAFIFENISLAHRIGSAQYADNFKDIENMSYEVIRYTIAPLLCS
mgnify:CR=1 FL=1